MAVHRKLDRCRVYRPVAESRKRCHRLNRGFIRWDRRQIGLGDPPIFAVESLAFARRDKNDFRGCRSDAKKNDRERGPRHCASSYHFVIAVWKAKEAQFIA